ncbi:hypothetical protein BH23PSE2_BH23PSE2_08420 [soil metagenome]
MNAPMSTSPNPQSRPPRSRLRRWMVGISVLLVLLAIYAVALRWLTTQIGNDVQDSLRDVPVLDHHTPRIN